MLWVATVRYSQRGLFVGIECDLLRQEVITEGKAPLNT
jgi:hypothetical protein